MGNLTTEGDTKMGYKTPKSKEEYWIIVNAYWNDIMTILHMYLPTKSNKWIDDSSIDVSMEDTILELKSSQNPKLARVFNAALWNIPEDKVCAELESWGPFYDLCTNDKLLL